MKNEWERILKDVEMLFGNCVERMMKDVKSSRGISGVSMVASVPELLNKNQLCYPLGSQV
jgi:hypothetical protein